MNTKQRWSHFVRGVPGDFRKDLEALNEVQLRSLHRLFIQSRIGGGTSAIVGAAAALPSCGVSCIGISIGSRRMRVNGERIHMIETIMRRKGWKGHEKNWKDYALPVTMGLVGMGIGIGGIDGMANTGLESTPNPADPGTTPDVPETTVPEEPPDLNEPPGVDQPLDPEEPPGLDDSVTPSTEATMPDLGASPSEAVPPSTDIPVVEWTMTENGIVPTIDGVPIDATYGQVDPSGLYQQHFGPGLEETGSSLAWGNDPGYSDPSFDPAFGPAFDPVIDPMLDPAFDPAYTDMPIVPPTIDPTLQYNPYMDFNNDISLGPTGYEENTLSDIPPPQDETITQLDQQLYEMYLPADASTVAYGAASGVAGVAVTHLGLQAATHATTHVATHATHQGFNELGKHAEEKLRKEAAKRAVKEIWKALENRKELPKTGTGPGRIQLTPEFRAEFSKLVKSPEWKGFQQYLAERESQNTGSPNTTTSPHIITGLPVHQQDCLSILSLSGYDRKLNEPERLKFFIQQADGNVSYVKAWIDEYLRTVPKRG